MFGIMRGAMGRGFVVWQRIGQGTRIVATFATHAEVEAFIAQQ